VGDKASEWGTKASDWSADDQRHDYSGFTRKRREGPRARQRKPDPDDGPIRFAGRIIRTVKPKRPKRQQRRHRKPA